MKATMIQEGVGQGGMFCGQLQGGENTLHWMYDCGSNQRDALTREIKALPADRVVDLLFLSHLDSDHVCGVDQLLGRITVRQVVLPYLSEEHLIAIVARDCEKGTLTGTFLEAAENLADWFGARGVERIIFVGGDEPDDDRTDGPFMPEYPEGSSEGDIQFKWTLSPKGGFESGHSAVKAEARAKPTAKIETVDADSVVAVKAQTGVLNWVLIPYVHKPTKRRMAAFTATLEGVFGAPLDKKAILSSAQSANIRTKLRECYDALWLDHNLVTMSLYSGPINDFYVSAYITSRVDYRGRYYINDLISNGGWLLTGDAHLDAQRRRTSFLKFYEKSLPLCSILMLPHHGAIANHSAELIDSLSNLSIGYAACGPNFYGHPHDEVRDAVNAHRCASFHKVCHKRSSRLIFEVLID